MRRAGNRRRVESLHCRLERRWPAHAWNLHWQRRHRFEGYDAARLKRGGAPVAGQVFDPRGTVSNRDLHLHVREAGLEVAGQNQPVLHRQGEIGIERLQRAFQRPGQRQFALAGDRSIRRKILRQRSDVALEIDRNFTLASAIGQRQLTLDREGRAAGLHLEALDRQTLVGVLQRRRTRDRQRPPVQGAHERFDRRGGPCFLWRDKFPGGFDRRPQPPFIGPVRRQPRQRGDVEILSADGEPGWPRSGQRHDRVGVQVVAFGGCFDRR